MRLALDEHIAPSIAGTLRSAGHDVVAVAQRPEWRGLADHVLLDRMAVERRCLATFDVADFARLGAIRIAAAEPHAGILLISIRQFDPGAHRGRLTKAIDALMRLYPSDDALADRLEWLQLAP